MVAGPPPAAHLRRGSPRVSSRRNTSLVVALGVASLAATSLAAMVATSELLTESITHPLPGELDPPVPDLGRPGVIQVEPPERRRAKPSGGHSRAPATAPPPRRRSSAQERAAAAAGDDGRTGVVAAVQRHPARQRPVAIRTPSAAPPVDRTPSIRPPVARPAPRPVRPPRRPEPGSPPRSWRRETGHKPHPGKHDRDRDRAPSAPLPGRPDTAGPQGKPRDGSPCPGPSRHQEPWDREHHRRDTDSRRWVGPPANANGPEPERDRDRDRERRDQEQQAEDPPRRHSAPQARDPHERSGPGEHRDHDQRGPDR